MERIGGTPAAAGAGPAGCVLAASGVERARGAGWYPRLGKRALDLAASAIGLVGFAPLLALIAWAVWLDSGRPLLYRGVRTGRHGRPFRIFKFRTMVPQAEQLGGGTTGDGDCRITRVGRFLRRFKLDELPQLLNVLRGEMSLVGPRPELPQYTALYRGEELEILGVRPGITDLASLRFIQLGRLCGSEDPDAVYEREVLPVKNRLRLEYARNLSLSGDLRIILQTILKTSTQ